MAGPLAGLGGQPQIPLAVPSQQSQNQQGVRQQQERESQSNEVQPQGAEAAQSQRSETNNQDVSRNQAREFLSASNDDSSQSVQPRGSIVDIAV